MKRRPPCTEPACDRRATALSFRSRLRIAGVLLGLSLIAAGCAPTATPPLPHSVYVWQRHWDAPLHAALAQLPAFAASVRVLAHYGDARGTLRRVEVDLAALQRLGLPVVAVVRLEGGAGAAAPDELARTVRALLQDWRAAGLQVAVEIDYDCATARLAAYAQTLAALRRELPQLDTLSITALPDWRSAAELDALLAEVDYSVLQVHAVRSPAAGLFDAALALDWIEAWSRRSGRKPFLVALPAYGARLKLDADGAIEAVESEQPLPRRSAQSRELTVDPREVAALIAALRRRGYSNLAGLAWFRLPRASDERAWSLATLRAVIDGKPLQAQLQLQLKTQHNGAQDLLLHNAGTLDTTLPLRLRVDGDCPAGDGLGGYVLLRGAAGLQFERPAAAPLGAGRSTMAGWLRCNGEVRITPLP